jgi:Spy/CpxP family protein refolding chaperone
VPNTLILLLRPAVQTDLALTQEQVSKLRHLRQRVTQVIKTQRGLGANQNAAAAPGQQRARIQARVAVQVGNILTPRQRIRLNEIAIQLAGPRAVLMPGVAKQLGLSPQQRRQIRQLVLRVRRSGQSNVTAAPNARVRTLRRSAAINGAIARILTPAQKEKLRELGGRPFSPQRAASRPN